MTVSTFKVLAPDGSRDHITHDETPYFLRPLQQQSEECHRGKIQRRAMHN